MCGRVNVSDHPGIQRLLDFLEIPLYPEEFTPRYNIAPGAHLFNAYRYEHQFQGKFMDWGIIPPWAKAGNKFSAPLINARSETVWEKPSFKNLVKNQRTIIPINGFYEWRRSNNTKTPFYIQSNNQQALAVGGLYQISADGVMQCCVITTAANDKMTQVHDRMPVIITPESMTDWLNTTNKSLIDQYMQPASDEAIKLIEVSSHVNNARNDDPKCVEPQKSQSDLFS